jgi:hypothetical protein
MIGDKAYSLRTAIPATYVKGKKVLGGFVSPTTTVTGSIQPLKGTEIANTVGTIREGSKYKMYTGTSLNTKDKEDFQQVQFNGSWYDIHADAEHVAVLPHNKNFLVKVKEGV